MANEGRASFEIDNNIGSEAFHLIECMILAGDLKGVITEKYRYAIKNPVSIRRDQCGII